MTAKLALGNIRKSMHDYAVYFVTLALGVAVFYAFNTISTQASFVRGNVGEILAEVGSMLSGVTVFLAVVMGFLMVYANNFLLRRRKEELGLYQVLGMRRSQVARILTLETLVVAVISLGVGIALGFLLSQLLLFVTGSLFKVAIDNFHFFFSFDALKITVACFAVTFLVMMALNTVTLRKVRLVELMGANKRGEKNHLRSLPLSIILFVAGVVLIAVAYFRLSTHSFPGVNSGTSQETFLVTTLMMVVGTIALFFGFAGAMVTLLARTKHFYLRGLHMFTTRQIAARLNSGSASMAMVALVLFLAITSVTTGMSICGAINEAAKDNVPFDATLTYYVGNSGDPTATIDDVLAKAGVDPSKVGRHATLTERDVTGLADDYAMNMDTVASATGQSLPAGFTSGSYAIAVSLSDYNARRALLGMDPVTLDDNQYLVLCTVSTAAKLYDNALAKGYSFTINGTTYTPASSHVISDSSAVLENSVSASNSGVYVLPDDVVKGCNAYTSIMAFDYAGTTEEGDAAIDDISYTLKNLDPPMAGYMGGYSAETATAAYQEGTTTTGSVSYLALYIGFVLVVACAVILAIQQLSNAEDSSPSYQTLSELGCPTRMIYGSLRSQTIFAFVLPLLVALAHSACALMEIVPVVQNFGHVGIVSSALMTVGIFVVVYGGYLLITYRTEHSMVHAALERKRHAL
jgi:putative ABC transport system permease protein